MGFPLFKIEYMIIIRLQIYYITNPKTNFLLCFFLCHRPCFAYSQKHKYPVSYTHLDVYKRQYNDESLPERVSKDIDFFGPTMVTEKHVVSLQNDRSSSYQAYIDVQNELVAAYNELRDELSQEKWGKNYSELNEDQQKAVREIYPQKISEAEPKKYGEKK